MTINTPFSEEIIENQTSRPTSKTLEFIGGLFLGVIPIMLLIFIEIFTNLFIDTLLQIFLFTILVFGGSIFAFVKRRNALGAGILLGFFGGFGLIIILIFALMAYAFNAVW
jgi:hypothetical protein